MMTMHGLVHENATGKKTVVQINDQINDQINVQLNAVEQQILSIVIENPSLTLDEIALSISKSAKTVQRSLDSLREKKVISRVGSRKDGRWEILNNGQ